ncbi:MAG: fimbrillin family protein, partial [Duncaniella sp.]|nr:fimbrillin family protein [Duncaniella sp.]
MNLKALVAGMGLLSIAASCSEDVTEQINTGSEIKFTTRMSRANAINSTADLKEFTVFAEAEGYQGLFINGETATKEGESSTYNLAETYRWPSDAKSIEFWAYAPKEPAAGTTININGAHQAQITGFAPAEYKYPSKTNSGASHNDLIVAYSKVFKSESGSSVSLNFKHTLSQIELRAKLGTGNKNKYAVKIKGAWFRNIYGKGDLSFDDSEDNDNKFKWTNDDTKSLYGYSYDDAIQLGLNPTDLLSESNGKSGLMVIPQDIAPWNIETDQENTGNGAYILILCRIEVTHEGDEHNGDYVRPTDDGTGHIHQMFPTPDNDKTFNENLYGYVCVPLTNPEGGWQAGKKYVYTLEFCGANSGAGLYPPT